MSRYKIQDYCYPRLINWPVVFEDLHNTGLTASAVCTLTDQQWSSMQRWRDKGTDPKHSVGNAILRLHKRHCGAELNARRLAEAQ